MDARLDPRRELPEAGVERAVLFRSRDGRRLYWFLTGGVFLIVLVSLVAEAIGETGTVVTVTLDPSGGGICVDGAGEVCAGPVAGTVVS